MTDLLKKAFREASRLPQAEQDRYASFILADLDAERRWDESFRSDPDALAALSEEAMRDYDAGLTEPLVPDDL